MCTQICYEYPRCGCQILGHLEECEHGREDPRCFYVTTDYRKPIAINCQYHARVLRKKAKAEAARQRPPKRLRRSGSTLWPLEGQMSVQAWSPAYYEEIQRREAALRAARN